MTKRNKILGLVIIGISFGYVLKVAYDLGCDFGELLVTETED